VVDDVEDSVLFGLHVGSPVEGLGWSFDPVPEE
jgi:hypothetical protein